MPSLLSNRISLDIPDADMQVIRAAIQTLQEKLQPHLIDLDADERIALPKMGAKTVDFVTKALGYARANPMYVPPFVDIEEFERDLSAFHTLRTLQQPLSQIADMVDDSLLMSGSEAYGAALASYQLVKSAAKMSQPGAAVIATDLADRFPRRVARGGDTPVTPAAPEA